jgi:hypothetical protein
MIKKPNKILLLLAAFYYVVQAESATVNCYVYNLSFNPSDPIPVTPVFEPDFSLYDSHLFTNYFNIYTGSHSKFHKQWRLNLNHFNQYIIYRFAQYSKKSINYRLKSAIIHPKTILYLKESDDIPLAII